MKRPSLSRRHAMQALGLVALAGDANAFGVGGFHPRLLVTGGKRLNDARSRAPSTWSWELVRRTSAPARIVTTFVAAGDPKLFSEPFVIWAGKGNIPPLSLREVRGLRQFLKLGGLMLVDDADPSKGDFSRAVKRELRRVLPESPFVRLPETHVIYKTYYILRGPSGRVRGPAFVEAIVSGKNAQVILLSHDLLGALAREDDVWAFPTEPNSERQRQFAVRFSVNLAMYLLCSDYKDDQVHAPWLMRRRARLSH